MMWPYYGDGWTWLWMGGMMVVFWGGVVLLAAWLIRSIGRPSGSGDDPMTRLRSRLASGEITPDEFENTKRLLKG